MNIGFCKDCKFWGRYRDGSCDRGDYAQDAPGTEFEFDYSVLDDSGLDIWIVTGPNFGCLHFENKGTGTQWTVTPVDPFGQED